MQIKVWKGTFWTNTIEKTGPWGDLPKGQERAAEYNSLCMFYLIILPIPDFRIIKVFCLSHIEFK